VSLKITHSPAMQVVVAVFATCAALAAPTQAEMPTGPVQAETSATITSSLAPDRPGARAALTVTIRYAGGVFGVPSPVRRSVIRFPAGLTLDIPSLHSCTAARLLARGPGGCPAQSEIGHGHALAEVRAGSQTLTEHVTLWAFLGPPRNSGPTLEILGQGYTPTQARVVVTGTVLAARAPYGEELVMPIPPIPTLPLEPDASMVTFSLTIGASANRRRGHRATTVVVPSGCPVGGFPFAAEFTYADGSTGSALATVPCGLRRHPGGRSKIEGTALAARTISLNENGNLHLISKHGFTLNEQGSASGTAKGSIYVHLTAVSTSRVTAEVSIQSRGGSISGYGTASYHMGRSTASFSGSLSINHGTGSYAHAHGSGLSFSGTIARSNDAITVHVSGRVSD
jgi:hypothetical protein